MAGKGNADEKRAELAREGERFSELLEELNELKGRLEASMDENPAAADQQDSESAHAMHDESAELQEAIAAKEAEVDRQREVVNRLLSEVTPGDGSRSQSSAKNAGSATADKKKSRGKVSKPSPASAARRPHVTKRRTAEQRRRMKITLIALVAVVVVAIGGVVIHNQVERAAAEQAAAEKAAAEKARAKKEAAEQAEYERTHQSHTLSVQVMSTGRVGDAADRGDAGAVLLLSGTDVDGNEVSQCKRVTSGQAITFDDVIDGTYTVEASNMYLYGDGQVATTQNDSMKVKVSGADPNAISFSYTADDLSTVSSKAAWISTTKQYFTLLSQADGVSADEATSFATTYYSALASTCTTIGDGSRFLVDVPEYWQGKVYTLYEMTEDGMLHYLDVPLYYPSATFVAAIYPVGESKYPLAVVYCAKGNSTLKTDSYITDSIFEKQGDNFQVCVVSFFSQGNSFLSGDERATFRDLISGGTLAADSADFDSSFLQQNLINPMQVG